MTSRLGDSLGGVLQEIQDDLLYLGGIGLYGCRPVAVILFNPDVSEIVLLLEVVIASHQLYGVVHKFAQVAGDPAAVALAAEMEHVLDDGGGPVGAGQDRVQHGGDLSFLHVAANVVKIDIEGIGHLQVEREIR